jgi:hypothetical protein
MKLLVVHIGNKVVIALMIVQKGYKDKRSYVSVVFNYPQDFSRVPLCVRIPPVEKHCIRGPARVRFIAKLIK